MATVQIVSYNLNGIRSVINKGWIDWVKNTNFDIIGVQETKAEASQVDVSELRELGYSDYWNSATSKKGYSGVAVFTKIRPDAVHYGIGHPELDAEGRVIRLDFGDFTLLNCYFPSGTSGDERQGMKYKFLDAFYDYVQDLRKTRPNILVQGDYNIAHAEIDLHNPKDNKKTSGFLPEERAWMEKFLSPAGGFVDSFRVLNPTLQKYSWWNVRSNARASNKGWRIDYQCVTEPLSGALVSSDLLNDAVHSDHCPCRVEINI